MKILMVQRFDLQNVSSARRVLAMAEELCQRGHEVVLTQFPHNERRKEFPNLYETLPEGIHYLDLDRKGTALIKNAKQLVRAARDFDIIHLWKCYPDAAIPALWASSRLKIPLHYDWDDYETEISKVLTGSSLVGHTTTCWERILPRLADTLSVSSQQLKEKAIQWGAKKEQIWDAPVGADLEKFQPALKEPDQPQLSYIGQLEVASFAELALDAFCLIQEQYPSLKLVIAGGGKGLKSLQQKVKVLKLENRVELTGYLAAPEMPKLLNQTTIALAPFENNEITRCKSPLKIVEYLAAGLPVIGSDVGEVPRMLGEAGRVVDSGNAEAIATAISDLMDHPEKRKTMRSLARQRAEEFYSWSKTVDQLVAAYETAVEN